MYLKHKGIIGIVSLTLGLLLIVGGTFGAFNDIEVINNTLAVGVCKLDLSNSSLEVSRLTPGNTTEASFTLKNIGTLFINQIKLFTYYDGYDPGQKGGNGTTADDFAKQFTVEFSIEPFSLGSNTEGTIFTLYELKMNSPIQLIELFDSGSFLFEGETETIYMRTTFLEENGNKRFEDDSMNVGFRVESICGDIEIPEDPDNPETWDKSTLKFFGATGVNGNHIFATITNGGRDMQGTVDYEVYWISTGNPKNGGTKVGSGKLQLASKETIILTYDHQGTAGVYKFKAFQRLGHPGKSELWSDSITVP